MASPAPHHTATPRPTFAPTPRPTPTPVYNMQIGATPLPVVVKSEPDAIWTYWVPGLGILISALAALFAGLALKRIGKQITIANQQIDIANQQIDLANEQIDIANMQTQIANDSLKATQQSVVLAQKDFDATVKSLAINEEQASLANAERAKKPFLMFSIDHNMVTCRVKAGFHRFNLFLGNTGDKTTEGGLITMLWPSEGVKDRLDMLDEIARQHQEQIVAKDPLRWWLAMPQRAEGVMNYLFQQQFEKSIFPNASINLAYLDLHIEPGTYRVQWMAMASDGTKNPTVPGFNSIEVIAE